MIKLVSFLILGQFAFNGYAQKTGRYFSATPDFGTHYLQLNSDSSFWYVKGDCLYPKDTQKGRFLISENNLHFSSSKYEVVVIKSPNENKNQVEVVVDIKIDTGSLQLKNNKGIPIKFKTKRYRTLIASSDDTINFSYKLLDDDSIKIKKTYFEVGFKYLILKKYKNHSKVSHLSLLLFNQDSIESIDSFSYLYTWFFIFKNKNNFKVNLPNYKDLNFQRQKFFNAK